MRFHTQIIGIPCQCEVIHASPARAMVVTGSGFGDADPPEPAEFEFHLLDRKGYRARWLENLMTSADESRLQEEFQAAILAERYGYDF